MRMDVIYEINKHVDKLLKEISMGKSNMDPREVEFKLRDLEREDYRQKFFESMCCNFTVCRYNTDGKCFNADKRKECVKVSRKVLCMEE